MCIQLMQKLFESRRIWLYKMNIEPEAIFGKVKKVLAKYPAMANIKVVGISSIV